MPYVDSEAIARIGYLAGARQLTVTFRDSGLSYIYFDVPSEEYRAFLDAASKGQFFNDRIKDRYDFARADRH